MQTKTAEATATEPVTETAKSQEQMINDIRFFLKVIDQARTDQAIKPEVGLELANNFGQELLKAIQQVNTFLMIDSLRLGPAPSEKESILIKGNNFPEDDRTANTITEEQLRAWLKNYRG